MNEHWQKVERRTLMEAALTEASVIVAFHAEQSAMLLNALPRLQQKTRLIPQAIDSPLDPDLWRGDAHRRTQSRARLSGEISRVRNLLGVEVGRPMLLLPAGLRPVKDVLFGARELCSGSGHLGSTSAALRIVGPELDETYARLVRAEIVEMATDETRAPEAAAGGAAAANGTNSTDAVASASVALCGALAQRDLHLAMLGSAAVLNTSTSEGMCNSVLEAMLLGTPVVARANAGNRALLKDGITGLLADSPAHLAAQVERLLGSAALGEALVAAAQDEVAREHSAESEAHAYVETLEGVLRRGDS